MNFLGRLLSKVSSDKSDSNVTSSVGNDDELKVGISFLKKFGFITSIFSGFGCIIIAVPIFVTLFILGLFGGDGDGGVAVYPGECGFTISATSLSKSEYKKRIGEYASSHSQWKIFADNADKVYDLAVSKNVNPELVVTVAYKEGNGNETAGSYNYWGLNCPNGSTSCGSFGSFMEGATALIDSASQYKSLNDWMSKYSYIGDFWYHPGDWGVGGCPYASSIYPDGLPDYVQSACSDSAPTCNFSANDSSYRSTWLSTGVNPRAGECTPTKDEDQKNYAEWLVKTQMSKGREEIFGLSYEDGPCVGGSGSYLTNYNLGAQGLKFLDHKLSDGELKDLNSFLERTIDESGHGTGVAVAAVGQALVYWLESKGYYLQYRWGGGHSYYTNAGCDLGGSFTFANPNWGSSNCGWDEHNSSRKYYGMDCSGFVSWATRTACNANFGAPVSGSWFSYGKSIPFSSAQPGDVITSTSHIMLVVKNNGNTLYVAEETSGNRQNPNANGLIFSELSASDLKSGASVISMKDWYSKNCTDIRAGSGRSSGGGSSNKGKILLVAGHSYSPYCDKFDNECRGTSKAGYAEETETRKFVQLLKRKLISQGFKRSDIDIVNELLGENFGDTSTSKSLYGEIISNSSKFKSIDFSKYKYAMEIHFNASSSGDVSGVCTVCTNGNCGNSDSINSSIRSTVSRVLDSPNNGICNVSTKTFAHFSSLGIPFTYLETEYYDNKTAMKKYEKNKEKLATEIAKVIKDKYS